MNCTVGPKLKVIFVERGTCESCEQCMKPIQKNADPYSNANQTHS